MRVTFLLASARAGGNSEQLARCAAGSLGGDVEQSWVALRDYPLEVFQDLRHEEGGYSGVTGNAKRLLDETLAADELVFVTPVYWYSVPAALKLYLDHWSHWMRLADVDFKAKMSAKKMWAIGASAGAADEAEAMFTTLKLSGKYLSMTWGGHVLGNGSQPGDVLNDAGAMAAAERLFK